MFVTCRVYARCAFSYVGPYYCLDNLQLETRLLSVNRQVAFRCLRITNNVLDHLIFRSTHPWMLEWMQVLLLIKHRGEDDNRDSLKLAKTRASCLLLLCTPKPKEILNILL